MDSGSTGVPLQTLTPPHGDHLDTATTSLTRHYRSDALKLDIAPAHHFRLPHDERSIALRAHADPSTCSLASVHDAPSVRRIFSSAQSATYVSSGDAIARGIMENAQGEEFKRSDMDLDLLTGGEHFRYPIRGP